MTTLKLNNIKCASCVEHVESELSKFDKNVNVNFATKKVSLDIKDTNIKDIEKILSSIGYPVNHNDENFDEDKSKKTLIYVSIFGILILYISMIDMVFPALLPEMIQSEINPIINISTQVVLTMFILALTFSIYLAGFKNLFSGHPSMYSLISLGTSSALAYSFFGYYNILMGNMSYVGNIYFETVAIILVLVVVGAYIEEKMRHQTSRAIEKLLDMKPKEALMLIGSKEVSVPVGKLLIGDTIIVKAGMSIPADGEVIDGFSVIDESMITGESIGVEKTIGDKVVSSSINQNGVLKIKVLKLDKDSTINQIIDMVQQASSQKAKMSRLADIFSKYFVWSVIGVSLFAFIVWYFIVGSSFAFSLYILIAILVIACPCAIGLAAPVSIMVALGYATKKHILVKNVQSLEMMSKIDSIVLDKTGTITKGSPVVVETISKDTTHKDIDIQAISSSLANKSTHPLSQAIVKSANSENFLEVENFKETQGKGISGIINNKMYHLGNKKLFEQNKININTENSYKTGMSYILFGDDSGLISIIYIQDEVKETSYEAILQIQHQGINVYMMSGDTKEISLNIASDVNIKKENVFSNVLPQEKAELIQELLNKGKKVAFVGDGINDSIALSTANIGFAIGAGSDIAIESSDIVLTRSSLLDIISAIKIGKKTIANIKQNLFFAVIYNLIGIIIASGLLYPFFGILLSPMIAALAMSLSSISVLSNALRLKVSLSREPLAIQKVL